VTILIRISKRNLSKIKTVINVIKHISPKNVLPTTVLFPVDFEYCVD
jgi:hypothetical protein